VSAQDVAVDGDTAFVASHSSGLSCVDITVPGTPVTIGVMDDDLTAVGVGRVSDHLALTGRRTSTLEGTLLFADVDDPAHPRVVAEHGLPDIGYTVAAGEKLAFAGGYGFLGVVDVANPTMPVVLGEVTDPSPGYNTTATAGDLVVVPQNDTGFQILDAGACADIVVFADGLEGADTGYWSAAVP
jgi:hypothetical protein